MARDGKQALLGVESAISRMDNGHSASDDHGHGQAQDMGEGEAEASSAQTEKDEEQIISGPHDLLAAREEAPYSYPPYEYDKGPPHPDGFAPPRRLFDILAECATEELMRIEGKPPPERFVPRIIPPEERSRRGRKPSTKLKDHLEDEIDIDFPYMDIGGRRVYRCTRQGCDKMFPSLSRMKRHYIIHTGFKPYKCLNPACRKTFSRKDNMLQHHKNHCLFTRKHEDYDSSD